MGKQHIVYAQGWVTLYNADALVRDPLAKTGDALRWKTSNRAGEPIIKSGFLVPPGSEVNLAKLTEKQAEKLLSTVKRDTPALASTPPKNPPRTLVYDSAMRLRAPAAGPSRRASKGGK